MTDEEVQQEAVPAPLLTLSDGTPHVVETDREYREICERVAAGTGPIALDAERASGFRYSARAYLIQLRREGTGTALIDPTRFDDLSLLHEAIGGDQWILHAASQDIPCLREVGLVPTDLFDTELAGRLLGYPRVGLATLVESILGKRLRKEHSAADWSKRPLPPPWLEYAALDVEPLAELRDVLASELVDAGKDEWARQEFEHLLDFRPNVRAEPWRRTSQLSRVRSRRALAAVRSLWQTRDAIAQNKDVTPGRIIPDSAIIEAALALPVSRRTLLALPGFKGRGAERYAMKWVNALQEARELDESALPQRSPRSDGPPTARAWAEKDPIARKRLQAAKEAFAALSEEWSTPTENLLTPDTMRRVLWTPPKTRDETALSTEVAETMRALGAREWQIELTAPLLVAAILDAES
ncbi:HRDC domain-containing protein [Nocardioides alcanivorans]|uniref:HRDC domain-containing protein n=1 Tax=Nocardioides alcanivorans TaxID=2897352 RepID=UPI001F252024|nr:ribonuclease D [Nocardioides alcanivorans]